MVDVKNTVSRFDEDFKEYPSELKPSLYLPYYSPKINASYESQILNANLNWLRKFNFTQETIDLLTARKYASILSRYISVDDEPERVAVVTDFTSLNSLIELFVSKYDLTGDLKNSKKLLNDIKEILNNKLNSSVDPLNAAIIDIWKRLRAISSTSWQIRFKQNFILYLNARQIKSEAIVNQRIPSLGEYMAIKPYTSMSLVAINLLEILGNCELNDELAYDETIQQLAYLTALHVGFSFDILVIERSLQIKDYFNLVTVCKKDYNLHWKPAFSGANRIHNHQIKHIEADLKDAIPFHGEKLIIVEKFLRKFKLFLGAFNGYMREDLLLLK